MVSVGSSVLERLIVLVIASNLTTDPEAVIASKPGEIILEYGAAIGGVSPSRVTIVEIATAQGRVVAAEPDLWKGMSSDTLHPKFRRPVGT